MAILMPTAVPIAFALEGHTYGIVTIVTLASILDGSIVGDHCSPISDTTIMSSIASSCDHMHHVRTQLPYSAFVAVLVLFAGYIPAGFGWPSWVSFGIAIALMAILFAVLKRREAARAPATPE
jgi:Na+/H+ antiporter NhaC